MSLYDQLAGLPGIAQLLEVYKPSHLHALSAPLPHLAGFIAHLNKPLHPAIPYPQFLILHAAKTALAWSTLKKGKDRRNVGILGDLFGFLVLAWGGSTLVAILLGLPPAWLVAPTPWIVYTAVYFLLTPTRMASYITSTCPSLVLNLGFAAIDGITRGATVVSIPATLTRSRITGNAWTTAVLSGIAVAGGGWIVQLLGLNESSWSLGMPTVLSGGVWPTLDFTSGLLVGLVNAALQLHHAEVGPLSSTLIPTIPPEHTSYSIKGTAVKPHIAEAISVLLMGSLLSLRAIMLEQKPRRVVGRVKNNQASVPLPAKASTPRASTPKATPKKKDNVEVVISPVTESGKTIKRKPRSKSGTPAKSN